ncbi:CHAT domain-containing protein [Phormidium tenue FACHB-886]|nr:CHAT domain-containing protein [Phormidium tenue FACHB-886]
MRFRLKVQRIEQSCLFELTWGQAQQLIATLNYSLLLAERYQDWHRIYLSFYKTAEPPLLSTASPTDVPLRGWTVAGGQLAPTAINWHSKLVEAEIKLLDEFHRWLRSAELFEIRATLARASQEVVSNRLHQTLDLFLTCSPIELARLPWEAWKIGADLATTGTIRIVRTPATIRSTVEPTLRRPRGRSRILAILGDETGLNFQTDREAVRSLAHLAEVKFVSWQPGQTVTEAKVQIRDAIVAEPGWDMLFFAGHSNETDIAGGELTIAPNVAITIRDIAPQLTVAKERGLQVAIFNSCSGLSIAESLIDLGFGQVVIMREPIHNDVAQEFLVQFLRGLADRQDMYESLLSACQFLRSEKNLIYPSAYLVPSLFCHPNGSRFRLASSQLQQWVRRLQSVLPTHLEAIAVAVGLALSLSSAQAVGLNTQIWAQAIYCDLPHQVSICPELPRVINTTFAQQIEMTAPGADEHLGIAPRDPDRTYAPVALRYWQPQHCLNGEEALACVIHHQLNQRLAVPTPDLWMLGIAVLLGKGAELRNRSGLQKQHITRFAAATLLYGLISLQLYISATALLPWLLVQYQIK